MSLMLRIWKFLARWPRLQTVLLSLLNPRFLIGAVAVIFDDRGRLVLFHHTYRRRYHWSFPGGWIRRYEEPEEALRREIREEAALDLEVLAPLASLAGPVWPNFEVVYLARFAGGAFRPSAEVDEMAAFTAADLPDLKPYQRSLALAAFAAREQGKLPSAVWSAAPFRKPDR
ncbi:MAG: NUDIX hydrolase [Myxococcales bacterium]|nr:NUDIX hydrolase [Myxococcales bacterium]